VLVRCPIKSRIVCKHAILCRVGLCATSSMLSCLIHSCEWSARLGFVEKLKWERVGIQYVISMSICDYLPIYV